MIVCLLVIAFIGLMTYTTTSVSSTLESMLPRAPSELPSAYVGGSQRGALPGGITRVVIFHYAPWCGACTIFRPTWEKLKAEVHIRGLTFTENNEEANPTPSINSYPTISTIDEWGHRHVFRGPRTVANISAWATSPNMVE